MVLKTLKKILAHPLTRNLNLDDPRTTVLRQRIIRENKFLEKLYLEWYESIVKSLPDTVGPIVELGAGAGFMKEYIPELIPSDKLIVPEISISLDAHQLPFNKDSLRAIVMIDVLHHLSRPRIFFSDVARCLRTGGAAIMIEPWVTLWSKLVYGKLHHEPFDPDISDWGFPERGPLSGANSAMPWIIFERDLQIFVKEFSQLRVNSIKLLTPFRYFLSGGVSFRPLMPAWSFDIFRGFENILKPWFRHLAMFAQIKIVKVKN